MANHSTRHHNTALSLSLRLAPPTPQNSILDPRLLFGSYQPHTCQSNSFAVGLRKCDDFWLPGAVSFPTKYNYEWFCSNNWWKVAVFPLCFILFYLGFYVNVVCFRWASLAMGDSSHCDKEVQCITHWFSSWRQHEKSEFLKVLLDKAVPSNVSTSLCISIHFPTHRCWLVP